MSVITHVPSNTLVIGEVSHYHFYQPMKQTPSRQCQKYQLTKTIIPSVPRQHCKAPINSPLSFIRQQKLPRDMHPSATSLPSQNLSTTNTLTTSPRTTTTITFQSSSSSLLSSASPSHSLQQRHRPPFFTQSSADLLKSLPSFPKKHQLAINGRRRKVSFDENVMVICTRFNDDESEEEDSDMDMEAKANTQDQQEGAFLSTAVSSPSPPPTSLYHGRRHSTGEHITDEQRQRKRWDTFVTNLKQWKPIKTPSSSAI